MEKMRKCMVEWKKSFIFEVFQEELNDVENDDEKLLGKRNRG